MAAPTRYLNNADILAEIHKSKTSFCSFVLPEHHQYDVIIAALDLINDPETILAAKEKKAKREAKLIDDINVSDLVFRFMTYEHIPTSSLKRSPKTEGDLHERVNFPPFQHWKVDDTGVQFCVGKSHWRGDIHTGHFDKRKGKMTENLGKMIIKLCEKYASIGNLRGYTYRDEMISQSILQLASIGLQFNEAKGNNPFSFYTQCVINSTIRILNVEKKQQEIRDDILEMNNLNPSFTRMNSDFIDNEYKRYGDEMY